MSLATATIAGRWQRLAGNRRLLLFCLLLFLLSSILTFWAFFPAEVLQRRLVQEASQQTGLQMTSQNASLLFPLGIELDLKVYPAVEELNPIELQELQVTPAWMTLFSNAPAIDLQGGLAGGNFSGQASRNGRVDLEFDTIAIEQLQNEALPYQVSGRLQGNFRGEQFSSALQGKGDFSFRLSDINVSGLAGFGLGEDLSLGQLEIDGKLNQRRLSLERVVMIDGLLEMSGGGTLLVGETPQQTRLNLNLRLIPNQSTPTALRELLNLTGVKPTADGSYLLRIGGNLAKPVLR